MDRTVQPVPDRIVTVDRTGQDRGRTMDRPVPYHDPVQRWVGPPFTRKWTVSSRPVSTHGPDRGPCGTVERTVPDPRTEPDRP
jgi:hypothetical protein